MKRVKTLALLLLCCLPLLLSGCVSNGYSSEFGKENELVYEATRNVALVSNLIEEFSGSAVDADTVNVCNTTVTDVQANAELLTFYNVISTMLETFDRLGVSVNVKQVGNQYILDYDDGKVYLTKDQNVILIKYGKGNEENELTFTFKADMSAFDMLYKLGGVEQCRFGYARLEGENRFMLATRINDAFQVDEIKGIFAGDQATSCTFKSYKFNGSVPNSILDGMPANFATGSGSIACD